MVRAASKKTHGSIVEIPALQVHTTHTHEGTTVTDGQTLGQPHFFKVYYALLLLGVFIN